MKHLTGRTRFRPHVSDDGVRLVLQVEFTTVTVTDFYVGNVSLWRDAEVEDLAPLQQIGPQQVHIHATLRLPEPQDTLPGEEKVDARTLH